MTLNNRSRKKKRRRTEHMSRKSKLSKQLWQMVRENVLNKNQFEYHINYQVTLKIFNFTFSKYKHICLMQNGRCSVKRYDMHGIANLVLIGYVPFYKKSITFYYIHSRQSHTPYILYINAFVQSKLERMNQ